MQSAGNLHCGRTEGPGLNALRRYPVLRELHGRFSAIRYFWVGPMGATKQVGRFSPLLFPRFPNNGQNNSTCGRDAMANISGVWWGYRLPRILPAGRAGGVGLRGARVTGAQGHIPCPGIIGILRIPELTQRLHVQPGYQWAPVFRGPG